MHLVHRASTLSHGALSHSAIAGIAVGATIFVALLAAGCYYLRIKWRKPHKPVFDLVYIYRTQFDGPERDVKCSLSSRSRWLGRKTRNDSPESFSVAEAVVRCGLSVRFLQARSIIADEQAAIQHICVVDSGIESSGTLPRADVKITLPQGRGPRHSIGMRLVDLHPSEYTGDIEQDTFPPLALNDWIGEVGGDNRVQGPPDLEGEGHDETEECVPTLYARETRGVEDSTCGGPVPHPRTPRTREHTASNLSRDASPCVRSSENPQPLSFHSICAMNIMAHDDSAFPNQGEQREVPRTRGLPHHGPDCMREARENDTLKITYSDMEPMVQRSLLEQYNGATRLDSQQVRDVSGLRNENFVNPFALEYKPNPVIFKHLFKRFFSSRTDQEPDTPRNLDGNLCPSPCDDTAASGSVAIHASSAGTDHADIPSAIGGDLCNPGESPGKELTRPIRTLRHSRRMASISEPFSSDADNHEHDSRLETTVPKATERERDLTPDQPSISPTDCDASPPSSSANSGASPLVVNDEPLYACAQCHRKFRTPGQRREHENRKHIRRFGCPQCAKTFNLGADLRRHQTTVHKLQAERSSSVQNQLRCSHIGCKSAGKVWDRKDNFTRHLERCRKASRRTAATIKANS